MPHHNPTPQSLLNMHKDRMSWLYVCMCPFIWFVVMIKLLYTTFYLLMWTLFLVCSLIVFFLYWLCNLCCYLFRNQPFIVPKTKEICVLSPSFFVFPSINYIWFSSFWFVTFSSHKIDLGLCLIFTIFSAFV